MTYSIHYNTKDALDRALYYCHQEQEHGNHSPLFDVISIAAHLISKGQEFSHFSDALDVIKGELADAESDAQQAEYEQDRAEWSAFLYL